MKGLGEATLSAIYAEIVDALEAVPGIRVAKWGSVPQPPAVYLSLPSSIEASTYATWRMQDLEIAVVVGRAVDRTALDAVMRWAGVVAEALDGRQWRAFDALDVTKIEFEAVSVAGATDNMLAAILHTDIEGA